MGKARREKYMKRSNNRLVSLVVGIILVCLLAGVRQGGSAGEGTSTAAQGSSSSVSDGSGSGKVSDGPGAEKVSDDTGDGNAAVDEDWTGDDKEGVALYLEAYDKLPSNYMTKKEARSKGWEGGALHLIIPGMCIGGDHFGNYEGLLPEDGDYRECDIDTLSSDSRGGKRIIYTDEPGDLDIWYTDDHYETFDLIYGDGK